MNTYVGITPTGVVIVKADSLTEAAAKFTDLRHSVHTIHVLKVHIPDVWIHHGGKEGGTRIHQLD